MAEYEYALASHRITYEALAVTDLKIDFEVQRTLSPARAQGIAENMVPEALGVITVSRRKVRKGQVDTEDQKFIVPDDLRDELTPPAPKRVQHKGRVTEVYEDYVMDGHHRVWAAAATDPPILTIMCEIHHDLTKQDEASLFLLKNRESWKPMPYDEYKVGLKSELPLFVDTQNVLDKHSLKMGKSSSQNVVGSVQAYLRVVEKNGAGVLDRSLEISERAFTRVTPVWNNGYIIAGVGKFIDTHGDLKTIDAELPAKLNKQYNGLPGTMVQAINHRAGSQGSSGGTGSRLTAAYQLCVLAWNKNRSESKKLPTPW